MIMPLRTPSDEEQEEEQQQLSFSFFLSCKLTRNGLGMVEEGEQGSVRGRPSKRARGTEENFYYRDSVA